MSRPARFLSRPRLAAALALGTSCLPAPLAFGQAAVPALGPASLPAFARPSPAEGEASRWTGSYARMSTGFEVVSSRQFGSYAGPTIGFEGGRMWQDGDLVYGVAGGFDYLAVTSGGGTPGFGRLAFSRDFAGALQVKVGTLVAPDVLVYAKAGALAAHETLRFGATAFSSPFSRDSIAVRPDARVGVEWAVTDRVSVAVEAGVVGPAIR